MNTTSQTPRQQRTSATGDFRFATCWNGKVLEHTTDPQASLTNAVRCARHFVLLSVPSVPDDNPEHIHLFTPPDQLRPMAETAGTARIKIKHVLNDRIALLRVAP